MSKQESTFVVFPTYSDIFKEGEEYVIEQLSKEGLAERYIIYSTSISGLLYTDHIKGYSAQAYIMKEFENVLCNTDDGRKILSYLHVHKQSPLNINAFTMMSLYQLLLNHRKGKCLNLTITEEDKLLYLKLILIANESRFSKLGDYGTSLKDISVNDIFLYEKLFWPILLAESDINETVSVEFDMFRLKSIIEYIEKTYPETTIIINDFFQSRGFDGYMTYASSFALFYLDYISTYTNDKTLKTGIADNDRNRLLLMPLTINDIANVDNFLQLKSHPLYYYNNAYYVINWSYFLSQIYIGTFKELESRIRSIVIKGLKDLKKEAGSIIERTLLKKVLENSFGRIWQKVSFDESNGQLPDALFQIGNHLFFIELKDSLMDEITMESFNFSSIETHIRENFVEKIVQDKGKIKIKKKGASQLASYIAQYKSGCYQHFPYNSKLNIYPIIVHTDYKYRLNGLNHYLSMAFDDIIAKDETLSLMKRRIFPLTVMGLDVFFNLQVKFREKKLKLADVIDDYHRHSKNSVKKYANRGVERYSQLYPSFERYFPECRKILLSSAEFQAIFKSDFFQI